MKIGRFSLSAASLALLIIQLLLVSFVAGRYLYQRWTCPRVWTRTVAYDPELVMRGRYLQTQLTVDGCGSTLPSAKHAIFPRDVNGAVRPGPYMVRPAGTVSFQAELKVIDNKLIAVQIEDPRRADRGQSVSALPGSPCDQLRLDQPVDFYIAEHTQSPLPLKAGQELWIEVTLPTKGPPRPLQLALKNNGAWEPLGLN
jgi:hypothetical protein